jgi:hypothetical protein
MDLGILYADHVNHLCVDDEDDHRILVTKCGLRVGYTSPKNRQKSSFGDHVTCLACMTLDENVDPDQRERSFRKGYASAFADVSSPSSYRCNVPMCGESGVCEECRKRGAR